MKPRSKIIIILFLILAIFLSGILVAYENIHCDEINTLITSIIVEQKDKKVVGFDLNKENVTFGTVSSGAIAERSVFSRYSKEAKARVWIETNKDWKSWVDIVPKKFKVIPDKKQKVRFKVYVPNNAAEGKYEGRIVFCYNDKGLSFI